MESTPAPGMTTTHDALGRAVTTWLDHLRVERGLSPHTIAAYTRDLNRYTAHLRGRGIDDPRDVGERDVDDFVQLLRDGDDDHAALSAASSARALASARGLHRFLHLEGVTVTDPAHQVSPPAAGRRLPKGLSVHDVERLLDGAGGGDTPVELRDRALLEFLYGTGARIGEAVGLDVDDLDLESGAVRLLGKGGKERIVPVGRHARAHLNAYLVRGRPALPAPTNVRLGAGEHAALFLNHRRRRLSRQSAWAVVRHAAHAAGLNDVSPHTLRHSFATHLLDGGADVRVVQELLGHASVTTTQIYTQVTARHLREVYAQAHPRAR